MTQETNDVVGQLQRLLAGFAGENELKVGPHMLAHGIEEALAELQSQSARIAELREALKPFAAMAEYLDNTEARRDAIYCGGSPGLRCEVKQSDYHRALISLTKDSTSGGER